MASCPLANSILMAGPYGRLARGASLCLAAGITEIEGEFERQDAVQLYGPEGQEVGPRHRQLWPYRTQSKSKAIALKRSPKFWAIRRAETVIHRDNLVVHAL
jgi:glutamate 5-kinase